MEDEETDKADTPVVSNTSRSHSTKARIPMNLPSARIQDLTIPLFGGGVAVLRAPMPMSKDNLEHIKKWLMLYEETLVEENIDEEEQERQDEE